jgi:hypothetical protein
MSSKKTPTQDISRADAAAMLEDVIDVLFSQGADYEKVDAIRSAFKARFTMPRSCQGEAHANPNIDHCSVCMPNWGTVRSPIRVK